MRSESLDGERSLNMMICDGNQAEYNELMKLPIRDYVLRVKDFVNKSIRAKEAADRMKRK